MYLYTHCTLSLTTTRVQILARACEKVTSDWGYAVVINRYSVILHHIQLANNLIPQIIMTLHNNWPVAVSLVSTPLHNFIECQKAAH